MSFIRLNPVRAFEKSILYRKSSLSAGIVFRGQIYFFIYRLVPDIRESADFTFFKANMSHQFAKKKIFDEGFGIREIFLVHNPRE